MQAIAVDTGFTFGAGVIEGAFRAFAADAMVIRVAMGIFGACCTFAVCAMRTLFVACAMGIFGAFRAESVCAVRRFSNIAGVFAVGFVAFGHAEPVLSINGQR